MGLQGTIAAGIATADTVTKSLQANVTHEAWTGNDGYGVPEYASGVTLTMLVEQRQELVRDFKGVETVSTSKLTNIAPITANGSANRQEPVDPRDRFTLPDGSTQYVAAVGGLVNPDISAPYMLEVWLG